MTAGSQGHKQISEPALHPLDHDVEEKSFMSFDASLGHFRVRFFRKDLIL
jgi:hypothetical protein